MRSHEEDGVVIEEVKDDPAGVRVRVRHGGRELGNVSYGPRGTWKVNWRIGGLEGLVTMEPFDTLESAILLLMIATRRTYHDVHEMYAKRYRQAQEEEVNAYFEKRAKQKGTGKPGTWTKAAILSVGARLLAAARASGEEGECDEE